MATPGNSHHNDVEKNNSVGTAAGLGRSRRRRESCLQNDSYHNVTQEYYTVFSLLKISPRLTDEVFMGRVFSRVGGIAIPREYYSGKN